MTTALILFPETNSLYPYEFCPLSASGRGPLVFVHAWNVALHPEGQQHCALLTIIVAFGVFFLEQDVG